MAQPKPEILIVAEERFFREAVRDLLRADSHECVLAENGEQALEAARAARIGVVVVDIRLPRMSGLEVLSQLRSKYPILRVIVISSRADQEDVLEALRLGACDYLAKPLHDEELLLAVQRAVAAHGVESDWLAMQRRLLSLETWLQDLDARARERTDAGAAQMGVRISEAISQVVGASKSSVMLLDEDAGLLRVVATNGRYLEPREMDPVPVGEGIAGLAFSRGKAVVIDDMDTDERFSGRAPRDRYASGALAVIPFGRDEAPRGVLCAADRDDGGGFGDAELGLLRILALQAGQLLAQRSERTARHPNGPPPHENEIDAELARLICEALTREADPACLVEAVLQPVARLLPAAPVALYLIDNVAGELVLEGQTAHHERPDRARLPRDQGLSGAVLQTGRLVASDHPETDPRFELSVDTPADEEVGPLLCVPLRLRGKSLGVVRAFPTASGRTSARTAEVLASVLSAAIRNVLLYRSVLESIDDVAAARREAEA